MAMASAPGIPQFVDQLLDAGPIDRAADRDDDPAPHDGRQAGVGADALELGAQVVHRDLAPGLVLGE